MDYDPFDPFSEPPMYTDYTLKFADQAAADAVLYEEQTTLDGDVVETIKVPKYAAVDVIGTIYKPTGKMLKVKDSDPVPEMKAIPGFHVNVRHTESDPDLDAFVVQVDNPVRAWA